MAWVIVISFSLVMCAAMYWVTRWSRSAGDYVTSGVILAVCWIQLMQLMVGEEQFSQMMIMGDKMPTWVSAILYSLITVAMLLKIYGMTGREKKKGKALQ